MRLWVILMCIFVVLAILFVLIVIHLSGAANIFGWLYSSVVPMTHALPPSPM